MPKLWGRADFLGTAHCPEPFVLADCIGSFLLASYSLFCREIGDARFAFLTESLARLERFQLLSLASLVITDS